VIAIDSLRRRAMRNARRLLGFFLLLGVFWSSAGAEPIASSRGRWAGTVGEQPAGSPVRPGALQLRVDGGPERFTVSLAGAAGELFGGEFRAGERKDVFGAPTSKGMMARLGLGTEAGPAEGKPLAWARRAGEELVVYRLELRNGAHRLDRLALAPAGERIGVTFERREHDRAPARFTATLERSAR
jgi:hypothetical protein